MRRDSGTFAGFWVWKGNKFQSLFNFAIKISISQPTVPKRVRSGNTLCCSQRKLKLGRTSRDSCQGFSCCLLLSVNHFTKNNKNCSFRRTKPGNLFPSLGRCLSFSLPQIHPHQGRSAPLRSPKNLRFLHAAETVEVCGLSFFGWFQPNCVNNPTAAVYAADFFIQQKSKGDRGIFTALLIYLISEHRDRMVMTTLLDLTVSVPLLLLVSCWSCKKALWLPIADQQSLPKHLKPAEDSVTKMLTLTIVM